MLRLFAVLLIGAVSMVSIATAIPHEVTKKVFYVIRSQHVSARDLQAEYQVRLSVSKDFPELSISIIFSEEDVVNELKDKNQISYYTEYMPGFFRKELPKKYSGVMEDGSKSELFTGEDWAYKKVKQESLAKAGLTGRGVVLVYLDTGINNPSHKTAKGKIERWYDWVKYTSDPYDDLFFFWSRSHGQETLSVATQILPEAKIHFHKIHSAPNGENYFEDILEALNQIAVDKNTDPRPFVVNMSFCLVGDNELFDIDYNAMVFLTDHALAKIIAKHQDVFFVASAGNNASVEDAPGKPNQYPAGSDLVISVSAFNERNEIATFPVGQAKYFSALGGDVWAPGHNVLVADGRKDSNSATRLSMGTSVAAPFVSAEVGAICEFALKNNLILDQKMVFDLIKNSVDSESTVIIFKDKGKETKRTINLNLINFEKLIENLEKLTPRRPTR